MSNILNQIKLSGVTYQIEDSGALHTLDSTVTSEGTNAVAGSGIYNAITAATNALAEAVAEEMSGKTDVSAFTSYTSSTESVLSGKADTTAVTEAISEAVSGKLDTSTFATYSGNVDTALASKFAGATWNSTDKKIYFYDNASATGTALAYIDGTDFVKDGFLESVTIENKTISGESVPCLVFIWNTDAGIQETDIPLSGIFDPTNYVSVATFTAYTASTDTVIGNKADTTAMTQAISEATSGKADTTAVTQAISEAVSGKVDTSTYTAYTAATDTALAGKQATLVSGTNIKTVGGNSLLGSGDVPFPPGMTASVSGTTLIFE